MDATQKLSKGRVGVMLDHCFFGRILYMLGIKEDSSCPTGYTDGRIIGYNKEFIAESSMETVSFFLVHEVCHVAFMHHLRRGARDHKKWNIACDYVVNLLLRDAKFDVPEFALLDDTYLGMGVEEVYNLLPSGEGDGEGDPGEGEGGIGEVRDYPGDASDRQKAEQDVKVMVSQAYNQAKASGSVPEGFERVIEGLLNPKVDWREVLRDMVSNRERDDYSWRRPNRRYGGGQVIFPTLYSESVGEVAIAVDTSGSIGDEELQMAASEISAILDEFPSASVRTIYCDSKVYPEATQVFEQGDFPVELKAMGGGGTRFTPVFEYLSELDTPPTMLVYITDLCCHDYPDTPPDYPVLWCRTCDYTNEVPFGTVVDLF